MHFEYAVRFALENEGVWSNDRYDSGGETKYGITKGTLTRYQATRRKLRGVAIRDLTREQAIQIYRDEYWKFDSVESRIIATKLFDMTVNFGLGGATLIAQRAVNWLAGRNVLVPDGAWGPRTRAAVVDATEAGEREFFKALVFFCAKRYLEIVERNPTQITFIDGWLARAARRP